MDNISWIAASLAGALIVTALLSRLVLWIFKGMGDNLPRILSAHAVTLAFMWIVAAFGFGRDGSLAWGAGLLYVVPQLVCLVVDLFALKGRKVRAAEAKASPAPERMQSLKDWE